MNFKRLSLTVLLATVITGCATPPPYSGGKAPARDVNTLVAQAEQASPIKAAELKLQAAQLLLDQGREDDAANLLADTDTSNLPPALRFDIISIQTRQALRENDGDRALSYLAYMPALETLPEGELYQAEQLYADAYRVSGQPLDEAKILIESSDYIQEETERQAMHNRIWEALQQVPDPELDYALQTPNNNYILQGWLELAKASRTITDVTTQSNNIENWLAVWQAHPAAFTFPGNLNTPATAAPIDAQRIGILLPSSGSLSNTARAIQEGIMAAHYSHNSSGNAPQLEFIDSTLYPDTTSLLAAISQRNVQLVIGPLEKDKVEQLAQLGSLPIPFLALNYTDASATNLYQYGLSAEDEARDAATQAFNAGKRHALIITPNTDWGARAEQAFADTFTSLGGSVVDRVKINEGSITDDIERALKADQSKARAKELRRITGLNFEFEERSRRDADTILLSARPLQARLLKPIMTYYYADIPVYATSQVYSGTPNSLADNDMNGIMFGDIPWVLNPPSQYKNALSAVHNDTQTRFGRLYAMGVDAYNLYTYLPQLLGNPGARLDGETGQLSLNSKHQVMRHLQWAVFANGVPQNIE